MTGVPREQTLTNACFSALQAQTSLRRFCETLVIKPFSETAQRAVTVARSFNFSNLPSPNPIFINRIESLVVNFSQSSSISSENNEQFNSVAGS